jgi:GT2 family glycosyltransferase
VESFRKFGYQIKYNIDEPLPKVELFLKPRVLNEDVIEGLQALFSQTSYEKLTVLLIVGSSKPGDLSALRQIKDDRLRITHGVSARDDVDELNALIDGSSAEIVGLLDEDCLQFSPAWLENLLAVLHQKGVGSVAPKIIYPNGLIFSCGLVLGVDGLASRLFNGVSNADPSYYFGWASLHKGYSALPKECILFKRSDFVKVNGLDRDLESQAACMVDFCLKLRHHGLRNVLLPEVLVTIKRTSGLSAGQDREEVVHHPSDRAILMQKWQNWIEEDPAFNPNLTLHQGKPIVKAPPR